MTYLGYSNISTEWGTLFGLGLNDLTEEQIHKLCFEKLIEFLPNEKIEKIIVERINRREFDIDEINYLLYAVNKIDNFKNICPNITKAYNDFIYITRQDADAGPSKTGKHELMKQLLNDKNLYNELIRSLKFNDSYTLTNVYSTDLEWIKSIYNDEVYNYWKIYIDNKLKNRFTAEYELVRFFKVMNAKQANDFATELKNTNKDWYYCALASPHLNNNDTHDIIKSIRKTTSNHHINAVINESIINRFATVTRLEVVEKILYASSCDTFPFSQDLNTDKMSELLFGSSIKYNNRFNKVIKRYGYDYERHYPKENLNVEKDTQN